MSFVLTNSHNPIFRLRFMTIIKSILTVQPFDRECYFRVQCCASLENMLKSLRVWVLTLNKKSPACAFTRHAGWLPSIVSTILAGFDECCIFIAAWSKEQTLSWNHINNCQGGAWGEKLLLTSIYTNFTKQHLIVTLLWY